MEQGTVFNIERFATEDGPGIRTVVFLKGCPLRCIWCANPESQRLQPDILTYAHKCTRCGRCIARCAQQALREGAEGILWDAARCTACGACEQGCLYDAIKLSGKRYTVSGVLHEVEKDRSFYERSGGGVTYSGGEPAVQGPFFAGLLRASKQAGLHTAVESCGMPSPIWEEALPDIDLLYLDYKHVDLAVCKEQLGGDYVPYLENIRALAHRHPQVIIRIPCIPGFNHSDGAYAQIATALAEMGGFQRIELLPYHRLGQDKYRCLGREYRLEGHAQMEKSELAAAVDIFRQYGLQAIAMPE